MEKDNKFIQLQDNALTVIIVLSNQQKNCKNMFLVVLERQVLLLILIEGKL